MSAKQRERHKQLRYQAACEKEAEKYRDYYDDLDYDPDDYCWQCGGEGWLVAGEDLALDDPVNNCDWSMGVDAGEAGRCPCCRGSGSAEDCTYW